MHLVKKYNQLQNVPKHMREAYKDSRYSVVIPDTRDFRIAVIDWTHVDWINYICMKGRMWDKKGKAIKI